MKIWFITIEIVKLLKSANIMNVQNFLMQMFMVLGILLLIHSL